MKKNGILRRLMGMSVVCALLLSLMPGYSIVSASVPAASGAMETFEDAAFATEGVEGTTLFTGTADKQTYNIGSYLFLEITGVGNKAEILTDPVTSSRALKITHCGSGTIDVSNYYSGNSSKANISNKIIKTGCKVRLVSQKDTAIVQFNRIDKNVVTAASGVIWNKKFAGNKGNVLEITDAETLSGAAYVSTSVTYNYATSKVVRQSGAATLERSGESSETQFNRTWYRFTAPSGSYTSDAWKGTDADTTEIWLDDLFFETYAYEPQISVAGKAGAYKHNGSYTSATLTDIPLNAPIDVRFSGDCGDDAISTSSYTLKDSSDNDVAFTVERFAGNIVTVFPENQVGGETYTFTTLTGIKSAENAAIDTRTARSVTYTTVTNNLEFIGFVESENFNNAEGLVNGKVNVLVGLNNDTIGVATDPLTGDKALKVSINNSGSTAKYQWILPDTYTKGRFVTTFDLRIPQIDLQNGYLMSFGSSSATDGRSSGWSNRIASQHYWAIGASGTLSDDQWFNRGNINASAYFPVTLNIDFTAQTFSGQVFRNYGLSGQLLMSKSKSFSSASDCTDLKYIQIGQFKKTASTSATEIYIDNLRVAQYEVVNFKVKNVALSGNAVQAELYNYTGVTSNYTAIAVQLDGNGDILHCDMQSGTVSTESVDIDIDFDASAASYELYVWDDLTNINPLVHKISISGS